MTSYINWSNAILDDTGDEHVKVYLRPEAAIKFARRVRKVAFFVTTGGMTYTTVPDEDGEHGRGYDLEEDLKVSAAQFIEVLEKKRRFEEVKDEEHFVRITRLGSCVFLG